MTCAGSHEPLEADLVPASKAAGGEAAALPMPAGPPALSALGSRDHRKAKGAERCPRPPATASASVPRESALTRAERCCSSALCSSPWLSLLLFVCFVRGRDYRSSCEAFQSNRGCLWLGSLPVSVKNGLRDTARHHGPLHGDIHPYCGLGQRPWKVLGAENITALHMALK